MGAGQRELACNYVAPYTASVSRTAVKCRIGHFGAATRYSRHLVLAYQSFG